MKYFSAIHHTPSNILVMIFMMVLFCCIGSRKPTVVVHTIPYDRITHQLDSIAVTDQRYRAQLDVVAANYGAGSPQMKLLQDSLAYTDSLNLRVVSHIIDSYGWLGPLEIGANANLTLFMVVQHSTLPVQQKYLPVMRQAVTIGRAKGSSLALLEDRVALREGRQQLYGSQLYWDMRTNVYYVAPLADPDHVDQRRTALGLPPMATYIMDCCNLVWDVQAYKKDARSLKSVE